MSDKTAAHPATGGIPRPLSGDPGNTDLLVGLVADKLRARFTDVSGAMTSLILEESVPLDQADLTTTLKTSVDGNLDTILQLLKDRIPVKHARPSTAAIEYAYRLAEHRVPADALRRAYHLGSEALRRESFVEVERLDCSPNEKLHVLHYIDGFLHTYVDWMSAEVLAVHAQETRRLTEFSASATATMIRNVLNDGDVPSATFESTTHYRLGQKHRAAVVWVDRATPAIDHTASLMNLVDQIARAPGCNGPVLFTAVDRGSAWVWFNMRAGDDFRDAVAAALATLPGSRIAFGSIGNGSEGFRRSHRQAIAAARVARVSTGRKSALVSHDDPGVAVASILTRDMAAVRTWIDEELGDLARATETAGRLRETYLQFLDNDSSYTQTGADLNLHRNTVKYRVEQALKYIGDAEVRRRADIAMALHTCRILGASVLTEGRE